MSVPVTTRLDATVVEALDRAVAAGLAPNRGSIVSAAVRAWLAEHGEDAIAESYRRRYAAVDADHDALVDQLAAFSVAACLAVNAGLIARGAVWDAAIPGLGTHPVVIVTRDTAIPVLSALVCALITSTFHGHVAEVEVGTAEGLSHSCAVNCDNVFTLPKQVLARRRGQLGPTKLAELDQALAIALGLT